MNSTSLLASLFVSSSYFIQVVTTIDYYGDCVGVFSVAVFNAVIAVVQEIRAKLAMDKVSMLLVRTVTVIRDGNPVEISHGQIVLGDTISIKRGDQAVVDGPVIQSNRP